MGGRGVFAFGLEKEYGWLLAVGKLDQFEVHWWEMGIGVVIKQALERLSSNKEMEPT